MSVLCAIKLFLAWAFGVTGQIFFFAKTLTTWIVLKGVPISTADLAGSMPTIEVYIHDSLGLLILLPFFLIQWLCRIKISRTFASVYFFLLLRPLADHPVRHRPSPAQRFVFRLSPVVIIAELGSFTLLKRARKKIIIPFLHQYFIIIKIVVVTSALAIILVVNFWLRCFVAIADAVLSLGLVLTIRCRNFIRSVTRLLHGFIFVSDGMNIAFVRIFGSNICTSSLWVNVLVFIVLLLVALPITSSESPLLHLFSLAPPKMFLHGSLARPRRESISVLIVHVVVPSVGVFMGRVRVLRGGWLAEATTSAFGLSPAIGWRIVYICWCFHLWLDCVSNLADCFVSTSWTWFLFFSRLWLGWQEIGWLVSKLFSWDMNDFLWNQTANKLQL